MNMGNHCLQSDIRSLEKPLLGKLNPQSHVLQGATVFIVNGEEKMRDFLNRVVKSAGWNTERYSSAESFLNRFESGIPSCLLLDADAPYMGGLRLQAQLQDQDNSLPIIFVSAQGSVPEAVQALQAGATDFIIKPFRQTALLERIGKCIEKNQRDRERQKQRQEIIDRLAELTPREREVMEWVVRGTLNKIIASKLDISIKTVEIHRSQVMKKLRAKSQAELIRLAMMASGDKEVSIASS